MHSYTTRTTCRVCDCSQLWPLFSLGEQYVSNFLNPGELPGLKCPIELELCQRCSLVQAKHTAPQELLYARKYWYRSGVTETMRTALRNVTKDVETLMELLPRDIVLDIGSNDGTLLRTYTEDVQRVGCEPADNLQEEGRKGVDILIHDFWSYAAYQRVCSEPAKVITALGMFYDLENPNQFVADVSRALAPDGIFVSQLMCLKNMINMHDVGNLAHEHLLFYSLRSLRYLFGKHGLEIIDIQTNRVNGESYRIYARHFGASVFPYGGAESRILQREHEERGLDNPLFYAKFFEAMEQNREEVVDLVKNAKLLGKSVWVYGASTKGNVLLQYYGLDHTLIQGAADRSPEKWGKVTVGTNIPIVSNEEARAQNPDYFLVLPVAFRSEFMGLEKAWRERGGRFIFPLPKCEIV